MSDWQTDFRAWQARAQDVRARAYRTRMMMRDRACKVAQEAGLGREAPYHYAHNASVGAHYGRPWRGVDYSKVRLLLRLERASFEPERLADRINDRSFRALNASHRVSA